MQQKKEHDQRGFSAAAEEECDQRHFSAAAEEEAMCILFGGGEGEGRAVERMGA